MFDKGRGVPGRDPVRAAAHYKAAAKLGSRKAYFNLGFLYECGAGRDEEAEALYGDGAGVPSAPKKLESDEAQYMSFLLPSRERALHFYMKAADAGDAEALENARRLVTIMKGEGKC
jgi:TPR repeat protein